MTNEEIICALRAELDQKRARLETMSEYASRTAADLAASQERERALREALEPFAEAENNCSAWNRYHTEMAHDPALPCEYVNRSHFKRAASALATPATKEKS